jgi:hypothetical protein
MAKNSRKNMSVIFSSMTFFSTHNIVLWVIEWCPVSLISLMVLFTLMTPPYGYTMGHDSLSMNKNGQKLLENMFFFNLYLNNILAMPQ